MKPAGEEGWDEMFIALCNMLLKYIQKLVTVTVKVLDREAMTVTVR
jgi:hypothetical protein